jgi:hypothetical protein
VSLTRRGLANQAKLDSLRRSTARLRSWGKEHSKDIEADCSALTPAKRLAADDYMLEKKEGVMIMAGRADLVEGCVMLLLVSKGSYLRWRFKAWHVTLGHVTPHPLDRRLAWLHSRGDSQQLGRRLFDYLRNTGWSSNLHMRTHPVLSSQENRGNFCAHRPFHKTGL